MKNYRYYYVCIIIIGILVMLPKGVLTQRGPQFPVRRAPVPFVGQVAAWPSNGTPQPAKCHHSRLARLTIDYPEQGSIFPPGITPPTFIWHDHAKGAKVWQIEVAFTDGSPGMSVKTQGKRLHVGEIDQRCISATNKLPKLTPRQASAWTWTPTAEDWEAIKKHSTEHWATVTITGFLNENLEQPLSKGQVTLKTAKTPVGAPIIYRDVPLMPTGGLKGVILPLPKKAISLIALRLRDISKPSSRLLLTDMPTCFNCHSFSRDGKTMGMTIMPADTPSLGMYALVNVKPHLIIRKRDIVAWKSFPAAVADHAGPVRFGGFMSRVSPDGRYVITMIDGGIYDANFKDYRFLQVFYPTRGILAYYDRATGKLKPLPGADDPRYVQTGADWSPHGKWLVFSRAKAKDPYPPGQGTAEYANAPQETQIKYNLYRIPFNGGKGGKPEPIAGASHNGMSNSFPRISPDGRWIVFVEARNGELMRPDSHLYIVPARGGKARRMRCNTSLMNSWHSFSPNSHWMVFSSKSRSPYTQMYLTHIDETGHSSPPILINNSTAANRAVNIPEFVNIPYDDLMKIEVPAVESYRLFDVAVRLLSTGKLDESAEEFEKVLKLDPQNFQARNDLGTILMRIGQVDTAIVEFQKVLATDSKYADEHVNFGIVHANLGDAFYMRKKDAEALAQWREALRVDPNFLPVLNLSAWVLSTSPDASIQNGATALKLAKRAARLSKKQDPSVLDTLAAAYADTGRFSKAVETAKKAVALASRRENAQYLVKGLEAQLALYEADKPFRESQ